MAAVREFSIGEHYSNEQIFKSLGVSNAGGVRLRLDDSRVRRMLVMTSASHSRQARENPYHDRIEGNVLVYTGAGKEGDQSLSGLNSRLPLQLEYHFPIYSFIIMASRRDKTLGPRRWKFLGMLEYLRHYQEVQVDARGTPRLVWLFEFLIHDEFQSVVVEMDEGIGERVYAESAIGEARTLDDRLLANSPASEGPTALAPSPSDLAAIRSQLLALSPIEFEKLIKEVLLLTGFERVDVTKYSQDGGIDVNAYPSTRMWPLRDLLVQVQAKRWLHTVGRREVAELRGSLAPFARGVVVTTSHFSKAAVIEAGAAGKNPIVLVDGNQFGSILRTINMGDLHQKN